MPEPHRQPPRNRRRAATSRRSTTSRRSRPPPGRWRRRLRFQPRSPRPRRSVRGRGRPSRS
ncbi:MAG: hypothetical protein FJ149_01795 [Euryarchaeota archaeon]|nr:hypothetical protein [Euryarchaeota archaeon]